MKNKKFVLTRQNQKGQVAVFVALIFQVIFVFFAILINVGLLVHHKINLQQSADLSAYYGAMKQSEIMNAISHVNFQMRQAWKLLAWRYRVVGTFSFQQDNGPAISLPLNIPDGVGGSTYNSSANGTKCVPAMVNTLDVPFFCVGTSAMGGWRSNNENLCKVNCEHVNLVASRIPFIPGTPGTDTGHGSVARATNMAIDSANNQITGYCTKLGATNFGLLLKYIIAYSNEVRQKKQLIQMLGTNLSSQPNTMVDMDGGQIKDGALNTFKNNLTESNSKSVVSFNTLNGLSGNSCSFSGNRKDGEGDTTQFLTEIRFRLVQFFIHNCKGSRDEDKEFKPASIYNSNFTDLSDEVKANYVGNLAALADAKNSVLDALDTVGYIVGYEKNPWCEVYYGVRAQTEPKIPFLPMAKVRLSAISFAKPFGGTIGPRYKSTWSQGAIKSDGVAMVDENLPIRELGGPPLGTAMNQAMKILPNYSNFVGDPKGLRDAEVVAAYQDMLLHRQIKATIPTPVISKNKSILGENTLPGMPTSTTIWPALNNWNNLGDPSVAEYDYLASQPGENSFIRDLELSVIAPNQFDLTYYSIDPDYFNNYFVKMTGGANPSFNKIKAAASSGPPDVKDVKPDYGNNKQLADNGDIAKGYSVRHQIAVAAKIIKPTRHASIAFSEADNVNVFKFTPDNPSSLLTGWTYENFSDFTTFPNAGPDPAHTMTFGKCNDQNWNQTGNGDPSKVYESPVSQNLPPTPGNCVWGGRTGYSVKIIAPSMLRAASAPSLGYGGFSTNGKILNPVDEAFFTF